MRRERMIPDEHKGALDVHAEHAEHAEHAAVSGEILSGCEIGDEPLSPIQV